MMTQDQTPWMNPEVLRDLAVLLGQAPQTVESVSRIDPVWLAEQLNEYRDKFPELRGKYDSDLETAVGLQLMKSNILSKLLEATNDTGCRDTFTKVKKIALSLGFEDVIKFDIPVSLTPPYEDLKPVQELCIMAHREKSLVLTMSSYFYRELIDGWSSTDAMNSGHCYFAFKPNDIEAMPYRGRSGSWESIALPNWRDKPVHLGIRPPDDLYFKGDFNLQTHLRATLASMDGSGTYLNPWPQFRLPLGMFIHWYDYHSVLTAKGVEGLNQSSKLNWSRYQECPEWFKNMVNAAPPKEYT